MKKALIFSLIVLLFFSCENEMSKRRNSHEKMMEFRNNVMVKESIKHDWYGEEMYKKKFSIEYNEVLESEKQLATYFEVLDVFKKDNYTFLLIDMDEYIFELKVQEKDISKVIEISKAKNDERKCLLIVDVDEFSKNKDVFTSNINLQDIDISMVKFFGKGDLLDIKCLNY